MVRVKKLGSILNLRGGSTADPWYANEVKITQTSGVDFYDFPMSATRRPSKREILTLLTLFDRCRYPLLIHCKSGSDRTGLAGALYLMSVENLGPEEAGGALTIYYGHVPVFGTKRLHEPLDEYRQWLTTNQLVHSRERFRDWVENSYSSDEAGKPEQALRPGPRDRIAGRSGNKSATAIPR